MSITQSHFHRRKINVNYSEYTRVILCIPPLQVNKIGRNIDVISSETPRCISSGFFRILWYAINRIFEIRALKNKRTFPRYGVACFFPVMVFPDERINKKIARWEFFRCCCCYTPLFTVGNVETKLSRIILYRKVLRDAFEFCHTFFIRRPAGRFFWNNLNVFLEGRSVRKRIFYLPDARFR